MAMPDLPLVCLPHPTAMPKPAEVEALANKTMDEILQHALALTGSSAAAGTYQRIFVVHDPIA